MMKVIKNHLVMLALIALPPSVVPSSLSAAPPQTSQATATVSNKEALNLEYRDGRLSVKAHEAALGKLLDAVTDRTGVGFNVSDDALRQERITVSITDRPLAEAIPLMLVDYNTLHVWDEDMALLQVNVLGHSVASAGPGNNGLGPGASKDDSRTAEMARIEKALEDLRSGDSSRRLSALSEVVGVDDPRIAPAILDIAIAGTGGGGSAKGNPNEETPESQLASEAALSLWRHGIERDFADKETVEALHVLEAQGNTVAKGIAARALEDMRTNF